jgi:biotin carboxyl carrier protein
VNHSYQLGDQIYSVRLEPQGDGTWLAHVGSETFRVELLSRSAGELRFTVDGQPFEALTVWESRDNPGGRRHFVALLGPPEPGAAPAVHHYELIRLAGTQGQLLQGPAIARAAGAPGTGRGVVEAPMPGQVRQMLVQEGERVQAGQPLLVLEAMKMTTRLTAGISGRVARVWVQPGEAVERGQQLVEVEPAPEPPGPT